MDLDSSHIHQSDIFIIGGGINGAGIAADAAGRGLTVTLCEKNDLASGTSSASSKLIHGGLRYLETYDFLLVRKALKEREILMRKAPHLIYPLEFILPHDPKLRSGLQLRAGLFLYDHLAAHPSLPNSKKITLASTPQGKPLRHSYQTGFSYYDCYDDDARLVIVNALSAKHLGATILTRTQCLSATREDKLWKIITKDLLTQSIKTHFAKVLINASGPWVMETQNTIIHEENSFNVSLIKGSHIVIPKLYAGNFAYILQNPDNRIVFAIPFENDFTLVGTTDVSQTGSLEDNKISDEETYYLLETLHRYFDTSITKEHIVWSFAGVRCLQEDKNKKSSEKTRDYRFSVTNENSLVTIISGKITTYRCLAEDVINALRPNFPGMKLPWTATAILPGGDFPDYSFQNFYQSAKTQYHWLPEKLTYRYAKTYGTCIHALLHNANSLHDLGHELSPNLYELEVDYLVSHEWAVTAEDILWRRTKLGLNSSAADFLTIQNYLRARMSK